MATAAEAAETVVLMAAAEVAAMALVVKVLPEGPVLIKFMTSQDQAVTAEAVAEADIMVLNMAATAATAYASSSTTSTRPHNRKETTP